MIGLTLHATLQMALSSLPEPDPLTDPLPLLDPPFPPIGTLQLDQENSEANPLADLEVEDGWNLDLLKAPEPHLPEPTQNQEAPSEDVIRLRWGALEIRPLPQIGLFYDDNVLLSNKDRLSDLVLSMTPGLVIGFGDYLKREESHLGLGYAPNLVRYLGHPELNSLNHAAKLGGQFAGNRSTLGAAAKWESLEAANRDAGSMLRQEISSLNLTGKYQFGERTACELSLSETRTSNQTGSSSAEHLVRNWFVYALTSKFDISGGLAIGRIDSKPGVPLTYEELLFRTRFESTDKLVFGAALGAQIKQAGASSHTSLSPVLELDASWTQTPSRTLNLSAYRKIAPSAAGQGLSFTKTGLGAGFRQRIIRDAYFDLNGGIEHSSYFNPDAGDFASPLENRRDQYLFGKASFSIPIAQMSAISFYCLTRTNHSSLSQYDFSGNQAGFEWKTSF